MSGWKDLEGNAQISLKLKNFSKTEVETDLVVFHWFDTKTQLLQSNLIICFKFNSYSCLNFIWLFRCKINISYTIQERNKTRNWEKLQEMNLVSTNMYEFFDFPIRSNTLHKSDKCNHIIFDGFHRIVITSCWSAVRSKVYHSINL